MKCRNQPLYPAHGRECDCRTGESWRMPLFDCEPIHSPGGCGCGGKTVRLENPCCPGECAEVTLSVDNCGNLVICVHRDRWKNHHNHNCCR